MTKISTTSMILSTCLSYDKNIDHNMILLTCLYYDKNVVKPMKKIVKVLKIYLKDILWSTIRVSVQAQNGVCIS